MTETEEMPEAEEVMESQGEETPSGFDRSSEQTAKNVLERLLPQEEVRLEVLSFFVQAILAAHQQGEARWGVTLYPSAVALNVSGFYACWIRPSDLFISCLEASIALEVRTALEDRVTWNGAFKRLPGSRCVYVPYDQVGEVLPQLWTPTEAFVVSTAERYARMGARIEGAHSPGVLQYLREYLEMDLPDPVYNAELDEAVEDEPADEELPLGRHFWKVAPGANGFLWNDCRERDCILIGWPGIGDIRSYPDRRALAEANANASHKKTSTGIQWRFAHDINIGDVVVANKGNNQVVGVGVVTSDYLPPHAPNNPSANVEYPNARLVDWRVTQPVTLPRSFFGQIPLTVLWVNPQKWQVIRQAYLDRYPDDQQLQETLDALVGSPIVPPPPPPPPPPKAVEALLAMADRTRNILLYGPPGTGKTWLVTQFARAFTDPNKAEMVTFHQSFAYEEFVEGIRPVIVEGQVQYGVKPGVFRRICDTAEKNPDSRYLLIIDEINRANIAKVLGELITLIEDDKRMGQANEIWVTLPYSGDSFGVPDNLTILGTMNTADRSIALLDLALRRRFTFVEMPPDPTLLPTDVAGVNLRALLERLNGRVSALLDRDHRIGHSYLMNVEDEGGLHFAWYRRVVPLLQEYFHGDGERLKAILGTDFVRAVPPDADTREALKGAYEEDARYEVQWLEGPVFLAAMRRLAGGVGTTEAAGGPVPEGEE